MTDWTRSTVPAGLLVALAVSSLGGCGGAPKPAPVDDPPVSASTSPTGAPTLPAEANGTTPQSAEAVVKFFIDALDYAGRTGDTKPMHSVAAESCAACEAIERLISNVGSNGGSISGEGWTYLETRSTDGSGSTMKVSAYVRVSPQTVIASPGASPSSYSGSNRILKVFSLEARDQSWALTRIVEKP